MLFTPTHGYDAVVRTKRPIIQCHATATDDADADRTLCTDSPTRHSDDRRGLLVVPDDA